MCLRAPCLVVTLLLAFLASSAQSQERTLRRMSDQDLKDFQHDALHDLAVWETTVEQIDGHLEPKYRKDHLARESADLTRKQISEARETLSKVASKETLRNDVVLLIDMDSLGSNFDGLETNLDASPDDVKDDVASTGMGSFSLGWQESMLNVRKQINHYEERFYEHVLATVSLADLLLPPDWLANSSNGVVGEQPREPLTKSDGAAAPTDGGAAAKLSDVAYIDCSRGSNFVVLLGDDRISQIGRLPCRTRVSVLGHHGGFIRVRPPNNIEGYVSMFFLTSGNPPAPAPLTLTSTPQRQGTARKALEGVADAMMAYGWTATPHWRPGECQTRQNSDTARTVCAPNDPNLDACIYDWQTTNKFTCRTKDGKFVQY